MEWVARVVMLLAVVSNTVAVDLHRFLSIRNPVSKVPEEAQVVEVVRWRQPVCVMPAQGVSPCFMSLRKFQDEYERVSGKGVEQKEEALWKETHLRSNTPSGDAEVITRLVSPEIVTSVPLSAIQPSEPSSENLGERSTEKTLEFQVGTPELTIDQEKNLRNGRYLPARDMSSKPQQIYVTKVLNSPVTATLVAHNCFPDVQLPMCQDYQGYVKFSQPAVIAPSLSISVETERPTIGHGGQGSFWEDPADTSFVSNPQPSYGFNVHEIEANHQLPQNLKPTIIISKPSFGHPVTSFASVGSTSAQMAPGLVHFVTAGSSSHTVTDIDRKPEIVSSSPPSKFSFHEGIVEKVTSDQSIKTEVSIELTKDSGNEEIDVSDTTERSISDQGNKYHILQVIQGIMNKTEKSPIVQGLQKLWHKSPQDVLQGAQATTTSVGGSFLGNIFKPGSLFHSKKTVSTTMEPEASEGIRIGEEESIRQPSLEVETSSTFVDILHKPENDISHIPGLLDVFGQLQVKVDHESSAKPIEKPGLFDDLFANPVRPVDPENSNTKS